ncbi:hypothetical protein PUNSTDRAFT_47248 [Punctularia strigosozonata HHB-11173 SS5]|uniref:Hydrophobin n=1 Tax=Punctularia strigosozonata (strain HHB-11173) TaxID=741275 RepID=R7S472_PUNST|nr:uncharacterized protein PUNSTDRAFT_47248 [Punctularia strigosozonata HHB-11173 SS5]EIN05018.1 hypothetical protein PUNSTDRAFT_47248 [Punctularia strigosozonata HHB-11173 SS5]
MFFKLSSAVVLASSSLAILAVASPADLSERQLGSCGSGLTSQCCSSTSSSSDQLISTILGLLGELPVAGSVIPVGLGCSSSLLGCSGDLLCCSSTSATGGLLTGVTGELGINCLPLAGSLPVVGSGGL